MFVSAPVVVRRGGQQTRENAHKKLLVRDKVGQPSPFYGKQNRQQVQKGKNFHDQ